MSGQNDVQATLREMWETRPARPRDDRKIAGVAAAIARRYDVDPVLVRVGLVVAAFYGIGLLLYLAGWVLLPDAGRDTGEPGRPARRFAPNPVLLVVLVIATIGTVTSIFFGSTSTLVSLAVVAGLLYMLHRSRADRGAAGAWAGRPDAAVAASQPTVATPTAEGRPTVGTPAAGQTPGTDGPAGPAGPADDPTRGLGDRGEPPAWDPLGAAPFAWDLPEPSTPPAQPAPPRPGAWLTPVTIGLALLAGGVTGAIVLATGQLAGLRVVFGVVLAVLGLGLLVGAFMRRGRGLALLAVPLIVLTYALTAAPMQGWRGAGELRVAPTTAAALAPSYERSVGELELDLRQLDLTAPAGTGAPSGAVSTAAAIDVGSVAITLPPDADVTVHCRTDLGEVDCLGHQQDGPEAEVTVTDLGRDGVSSGRPLNIDVSAGLGSVEVRRG